MDMKDSKGKRDFFFFFFTLLMEDQLHCVSHTVGLDIFTVYFKEGKETTVITGMLSVAIMKLVIILLMS